MPIFPFVICSSTFFRGLFCLTSHRSCRRVNNNRKVLPKRAQSTLEEREIRFGTSSSELMNVQRFTQLFQLQSSAKKDSSQKLREQCVNRAELYFLVSQSPAIGRIRMRE